MTPGRPKGARHERTAKWPVELRLERVEQPVDLIEHQRTRVHQLQHCPRRGVAVGATRRVGLSVHLVGAPPRPKGSRSANVTLRAEHQLVLALRLGVVSAAEAAARADV